MKTLAKATAERGDDWRDIRNQCTKEADDLLTRAKVLSVKHDVDIGIALTLLQDTTVYSTVTNATPHPTEEPVAEPAKAQD